MGQFAVSTAISYQIGAARGNLSILSAMDISPDRFFANFGQTINDLILSHRSDLERKRNTPRQPSEPKLRWVDGTPEYSFHICGLRKLFPDALFVHLVRDVDAVVRSLLNFHKVSGVHLVTSEEEAYKYWLRRVKACLKAEQAYGPKVVHRLLYSNLMANPEAAIRSLLGFIGETYSAACLEPLGERINSSNVPPDFKCDDPATDASVVEKAQRLWAEIEGTSQPKELSTAAADELEIAFQQLCLRAMTIEQEIARQEEHYTATLAKQLRHIQQLATMLDEVAITAATLRSSRFWTFANKAAAIEARLFRSKEFVPDRGFRKILGKYSKWRASHPPISDPNPQTRVGESLVNANRPDAQRDALPEIQSTAKKSGNSAST